MKKQLTTGALSILALAIITLVGCSRENDLINGSNLEQRVDVGSALSGQSCVQLTAGQSINAGSVCFEDIDTNNDGVDDVLRVCYTTTGGWELVETHFFIGTATNQIPMTKSGNPIPGQFPYNSGSLAAGTTSYCIDIPLSSLNFECPGPTKYVIAAHAAVKKGSQSETGWGAGTRIASKGNWGTYFDIFITCEDVPPPPPGACSETAFAYGNGSAQCFNQFSEFVNNPNRWGWTNGPLAAGVYTFDLYAGAGQCNLSNGTNVGTLTVNYNGSSATITYNTTGSFSLTEVHLYAGSAVLPQVLSGPHQGDYTLAPGQYPVTQSGLAEGTQTSSYTINGLSGNIYVVAHASVTGFECPVGDND